MHFRTSTRSKLVRAGVVLGVAASAILLTADPSSAAVALTITPATGPANNTTNGPTVTVNTTTSVFSGTPQVSFQYAGATAAPTTVSAAAPTAPLAGCYPSYVANIVPGSPTTTAAYVVNSTSVIVYSPTRLYVKVPNLPIIGTAPTKYNVCVYAGNTPWVSAGAPGDPLVASLANGYSVSAPATVGSVTPISGPAKGGTPIVVTGTNLVGASVTLGGVPLTPTIATDGLSFTAVTPPHAADGQPVTLAVTTAGGTVNKAGAFTYSNGIIVSPNTVPKTTVAAQKYVEVQGVGFSSLNALNTAGGTTPDLLGAHVYVSRGPYNDGTVAGHKANPEVSECSDVMILNDGLLLCKMNLVPYTRVVTDAVIADVAAVVGPPAVAAYSTITSPTANFTQNDVGMPVTVGTATVPAPAVLPAGTYITSVQSPTQASLSAQSTTPGAAITATIGNTRTITSATTATAGGVTTLTAATGTGLFTSSDIGRTLGTTGLFITSVVDTDNAILSGPLGTDLAGTSAVLKAVLPDGAYVVTVVNDGRLNASNNNPNYNQSVVSSGATFTVGDYLTH